MNKDPIKSLYEWAGVEPEVKETQYEHLNYVGNIVWHSTIYNMGYGDVNHTGKTREAVNKLRSGNFCR